MSDKQTPRWAVSMTYSTPVGPQTRMGNIEELHDIGELIETGPNFYAVIKVEIALSDQSKLIELEGWEQ